MTSRRWKDRLRWRRMDVPLLRRVLAVVIFAFVLGFVPMALYMHLGVSEREIITVPDVRGLPVAEARRRLESAYLKLEIGDSLPNPHIPAGAVVVQSPLPGREVGPGSEVRVMPSTGPEQRAVPQVGILSREQAVRVLEASGFQVQEQTVPSMRAAGRVVGTEPAAGALVRLPGTVRLLVSAGPPRVAVPDLVGRDEVDAQAALEAAGLVLGEVLFQYRGDLPEGLVLAQEPAAGDSISVGSRVGVVVATHQLLGTPMSDPR